VSNAFLGQIELFAFDYAPTGWAKCQGQLLPINQNQALFSLLGTTYGGDGRNTFALPDLRGRVPIGFSQSLGERGGEEQHTLLAAEMPAHGHYLMADAASNADIGNTPSPAMVLGQSSGQVVRDGPGSFTAYLYGTGNSSAALDPQTIAPSGGSQPHENRMPSLALNFRICIGTTNFPSRT
jgi:microcystin-dependent protein